MPNMIDTEIETISREITKMSEAFDTKVDKKDMEVLARQINDRLETLGKMIDAKESKEGRKHTVFSSVQRCNDFVDWVISGPWNTDEMRTIVRSAPCFKDYVQRDQTVATDAAGGYTVPDLFLDELIALYTTYSDAWKYHRSHEIIGKSLDIPLNLGGGNAQWEVDGVGGYAEGNTMSAGQVAFSQVTLTPRTANYLLVASNKLVYQSRFVIGDIIAQQLVEGMARAHDKVVYRGNGAITAETGGITGYEHASDIPTITLTDFDGQLFTTNTTGTPYSTGTNLKGADILLRMMILVSSRAFGPGKDTGWWMNRRLRHALNAIKDSTGAPVITKDYTNSPFGQLFGYPINDLEVLVPNEEPATDSPTGIENNQKSDLVMLFGSCKQAGRIGYSRRMSVEYSQHAFWTSNKSGWKVNSDFDFKIVDAQSVARVLA